MQSLRTASPTYQNGNNQHVLYGPKQFKTSFSHANSFIGPKEDYKIADHDLQLNTAHSPDHPLEVGSALLIVIKGLIHIVNIINLTNGREDNSTNVFQTLTMSEKTQVPNFIYNNLSPLTHKLSANSTFSFLQISRDNSMSNSHKFHDQECQ